MLFTQTPVYLFQRIYPSAIFYLNNKNEMALTFDDGPVPEVTEFVLEVLEHYKVKATFFCVGQNIEKHYNIFEKILSNGHSVGNHTYSHLNGWKISNHQYFEDIEKFQKIYPSTLFRPPYGKIRKSQYDYLVKKYQMVFWSTITYDYHPKMTIEKCHQILKKNIGGQIVLFHDSLKSFRLISKILPEYIEYCQKLKLTFVPLKNKL